MPCRAVPSRAGIPRPGGRGNFYMHQAPIVLSRRMRITTTTTTVTIDLSQVQKIIMLKNGTFSFSNQISNTCCCRHSTTEHIEGNDCCLVPSCLCDRFLDEGFKVSSTVLTRRGTVKKKKNAKPCVVEVGVQGDEIPPNSDKITLDSYIESLARM
jgi:hypothetical protein